MKVNKSSISNALKRSYLVFNSPTSRTAFNVAISVVQSCRCSDFAKNGHRVLYKHILFIALHVHNGKDLEPSLWIQFIEENDLRSLFDAAGKDITFLREQLVKERTYSWHSHWTRLFYSTINLGSAKKVQVVGKMYSSRCRKTINVGTQCIAIEGVLTVPFTTNKAAAQKFYYCLDGRYITNRPMLANIRPLLELTLRKKEIFNLLKIYDIFIWF